MIRTESVSSAAKFLFFLCAAAGAFFCARSTGVSLSSLAAAAGGALSMYAFTASAGMISPHRQHPVVSGEFSRALFIVLPVFIAIGSFTAVPAAAAALVFILFEISFFSFERLKDLFFTGIVSHCVLCVLLLFLLSNSIIGTGTVLSLFTGPAASIIPLSAAAALLFAASMVFSPRISHLLSPAARESSPAAYHAASAFIRSSRELSLFLSFMLCGAAAVPFILPGRRSSLLSKASTLLLYLAITFSAAAAVNAGWGVIVIASAAAASYIRFFIITWRKSAHAEHTRSFIHIGRRNRS